MVPPDFSKAEAESMIAVEWEASRTRWQALLAEGRAGLQQGWSYGEALRASGVPVHRLVARDRDGIAVACAQVGERRLLGPVGAAFLLRGPVWLAAGARERHEAAILTAIRAKVRLPLIWAPETPSVHARQAVISGYSTTWLDLSVPAARLRAKLAAD